VRFDALPDMQAAYAALGDHLGPAHQVHAEWNPAKNRFLKPASG
jgi:hypothetical protein